MDPELQKRIEQARNAGYSDEEISAALGQPIPTASGRPDVAPNVPVLTAEERARLNQEEANERARQGQTTAAQQPFTLGMGAAAAGGAVAVWEGGKWVLKKVAQGMATPPTAAPMPTPTAPVAPMPAPTAPVAPSPILDAAGRPFAPTAPAAPVAPTAAPAMPAQPAQAGLLDKTTAMIRQLAANKALQSAVRGAGTAAAALTPGNIGQNYNFPQSGPLRGSEINPQTGRPWTEQELAAYRAQFGG